MAKPRRLDPAGRETMLVEIRGTLGRLSTRQRARRGDFEWLAARSHLTPAQEYAGRLARGVWEVVQRGPGASAIWVEDRVQNARYAPQESILRAIHRAEGLAAEIGRATERRLRAFLLDERTVAEIADSHEMTARSMAAVLKADLDAVAGYFGYDPRC